MLTDTDKGKLRAYWQQVLQTPEADVVVQTLWTTTVGEILEGALLDPDTAEYHYAGAERAILSGSCKDVEDYIERDRATPSQPALQLN